jgi:hypothetical protein
MWWQRSFGTYLKHNLMIKDWKKRAERAYRRQARRQVLSCFHAARASLANLELLDGRGLDHLVAIG